MENVQWWTVPTPTRLIGDTDLPVGAKALYMAMLDGRNPGTWECAKSRAELAAAAGFRSVQSVSAHLPQLAETGWIAMPERGRRPLRIRLLPLSGETTVKIPGMLTSQRGLTPAAKCLYALLVMRRNSQTGQYQGRQSELLIQPGLNSPKTLQMATVQLQQAGWLALRSHSGVGGRKYEPLDPHLHLRQAVLARLQLRLERKAYIGEALMQAMLTECVADPGFQDNARLSQIANPLTGEPLEFDRLYLNARVAIEFNGPQHYKTTEAFPSLDEVRAQQARDLMKEAQAVRHNYTLVTVEPRELSFKALITKLAPLLPIRPLRHEDPVVRALDRLSRAYVRKL